jgi:hypothetical protein
MDMELKIAADRTVMEKLRKMGEVYVIQRTLGIG